MDQGYNFRPDLARKRGLGMRAWIAIILGVLLVAGAGAYYLTRNGGLFANTSPIFQLRNEDGNGAVAAPADRGEGTAQVVAPATAETPQGAAREARQAAERVEQVVSQQGGLDARVAAMEQRLTRLDLQSQAAAGNAARAEGLLIAFASRRALDRGAPLGYLADQLRLRFGDARPNAVQTVIDASQNPVTLDQLLARLDGLADRLTQSPGDEGVLQWIGREVSQMFIIRREDTPSPVAELRLERARLFLQSGRTEAAVAEIRNLPNAIEALDWIADAERFAAAQRALELIETTAVLEPRELRNGSGERVEQLSPAQAGSSATSP